MLDSLKGTYTRLINNQQMSQFRYLYDEFALNERLTGIIGPRGVGKTTLMLQYIKSHFPNLNDVFYFSADHLYFNTNTIYQFIEYLYQHEGIKVFFIDEIHKYQNWDQELKNIYDGFPDINIVFSGSSSLDLVKGSYDLSRRATLHTLVGLSFREYLNFKTNSNYSAIDYNHLINKPDDYNQILPNIPKVKGLFKSYLMQGYYPFFLEGESAFYEKILRVVDKTIHEDIAGFYNLKTQNLSIFKKIINYLSTIEPGKFSYHNLSKNLGVDDKTAAHYITILQDTGLIRAILPYAKGNQILRKPEKVFLSNTTLTYAVNNALGESCSLGLVRELYFLQSLQNNTGTVFYSETGDYRLYDTIYEIGGKNKTSKQLKSAIVPSFIVKDDILFATRNEIPLMLFGFLY